MPELPEVETTRLGISPAILNKRIHKIIIRQPKLRYPIPEIISQKLIGNRFSQITRRSKYLLLDSTHGTLILHLGMSGNLRLVPLKTAAQKHDHVDIIFDDVCLRFTDPRRFGLILWTQEKPEQHKLLKSLGPEPLSKQFTAQYLQQQAKNRKVAVKNFIMDSHVVVGVGNIYASEALFLAGIHPECAANAVSAANYATLVKKIQFVLKKAIKAGGTTLKDFRNSDGKPGYFKQELQVYGRENEACYKCKTFIKKITIGQRSSYFCPRCQRVAG